MGGSCGVLIEITSFCIIFSYRIFKSLAEGEAHTTGKKLLKKIQKANRLKSSKNSTIQSTCLFLFHRVGPSSP